MTDSIYNISASRFLAILQEHHMEFVVTVPDWMQLALHQQLEARDSGIRQLMCCNEDQAIAVAAGLHMANRRVMVMIQNQGFYACINTIRAIGIDAGLPLVMLIGQFGREEANFGQPATASTRNTVRLLEPVMTALGVRFWNIDSEADLGAIGDALKQAEQHGAPVALNVGAPMAWA